MRLPSRQEEGVSLDTPLRHPGSVCVHRYGDGCTFSRIGLMSGEKRRAVAMLGIRSENAPFAPVERWKTGKRLAVLGSRECKTSFSVKRGIGRRVMCM